MPWIHIDDLCDIYIKGLEDNNMAGAFNAVAPDHKTNREFMRALAHILKRPLWLPDIPTGVLKFFLGEMSDILLKGSRVSADAIEMAGFHFYYPDLENALTDLNHGAERTGLQS